MNIQPSHFAVGGADRRLQPRQRVFKRAKAIIGGGSVIDCTVRDISPGGARLALPQAALLPEHFELVMVTERELRPVRVAWRQHDQLGVEFLSPPRKALHLQI